MSIEQDTCLFSGTSHPGLAKLIADYSSIPMGEVKIEPFPDGEIFVQIQESVRGKTAFIVQSLAHRPNYYLMELLIMIDALKRASAHSVVLLIPYFAYSRQDRKDKGRVPITAKLVANLLEKAGADRVLTMDLHTDQVQGFFDIPTDNLYARPQLVKQLESEEIDNLIMACPDVGSIRLAKAMADQMKTDFVIIDKKRLSASNVELSAIIGDVKQKNVMLVDDMCSTATTLCKAATACMEEGAISVSAIVTHGLFVGDALEKIKRSQLKKVYVSDTIYMGESLKGTKIETVTVANLFGEAARAILYKNSISSLFSA